MLIFWFLDLRFYEFCHSYSIIDILICYLMTIPVYQIFTWFKPGSRLFPAFMRPLGAAPFKPFAGALHHPKAIARGRSRVGGRAGSWSCFSVLHRGNCYVRSTTVYFYHSLKEISIIQYTYMIVAVTFCPEILFYRSLSFCPPCEWLPSLQEGATYRCRGAKKYCIYVSV